MFKGLKHRDSAHSLYATVVAQARGPGFYRRYGVPDTLDGRFEMIVIHAVLLLRRLREEGTVGLDLGQVMFDIMIDDMDQSLREMGVGDLAVGHRVKAMARGFFGRAAAYEAALSMTDDADEQALITALNRNLYGTVSPAAGNAAAMADYIRGVSARLEAQSGTELRVGTVSFGDVPGDAASEFGALE